MDDDFKSLKLNPKIEEILKKNGIMKPTEIQIKTFPSASNGHDIIGVSQTGSGKTLAFLLPMIQQILLSDFFEFLQFGLPRGADFSFTFTFNDLLSQHFCTG